MKKPQSQGTKNQRVFLGNYFDFSGASFSGTHQNWVVNRTRLAYLFKGTQLPYLEVGYHERTGNNRSTKDETIDLGGYYVFPNRSFLHLVAGFGIDADFVYRFKILQEYAFPIWKNLFFQESYRFLNFTTESIHTFSPALLYYFGNHYLLAQYNPGMVTGRGFSQNGKVALYFYLPKELSIKVGGVVGQRVYDFLGTLTPDEAFGFLVYSGIGVHIRDNIFFDIIFYYGQEEPDFKNPGVNVGISLKL